MSYITFPKFELYPPFFGLLKWGLWCTGFLKARGTYIFQERSLITLEGYLLNILSVSMWYFTFPVPVDIS
jgi:hypothetical protein